MQENKNALIEMIEKLNETQINYLLILVNKLFMSN